MKSAKKKNEKLNIVGYVKVVILIVITVFLVLFIRNIYLSNINYKLNIPVIRETLKLEINKGEIYNYVRDNPNAVIYVGVASDNNCRTFELDFNRIIKKEKLEEEIIYLNLDKKNGIKSFFKEFNKFYDTNLTKYPSIIIFQDGKVEDILKVPIGDNYSSTVIEEFLNEYQVVNQ